MALLAGRGTGWEGRVVAADVTDLLAEGIPAQQEADSSIQATSTAAATAGGSASGSGVFTDVPHTQSRRHTAALLTESKRQVPHYYLTSEVRLDALEELRARLNASRGKDEQLGAMDLLVKAAAIASRRVPEANSSWLPDCVRVFHHVDVAVSTATERGLVTPVVRDAHARGVADIASDLASLTAAARDGTLTADQASGATLTVTNLGGFGLRQAAAVIHPPQAAHLTLGAATRRVVPAPAGAEGDSKWASALVLHATLSCDHRVLDGAVGAQWLAHFRTLVEDPATMIL